jgi:hypothetical protein
VFSSRYDDERGEENSTRKRVNGKQYSVFSIRYSVVRRALSLLGAKNGSAGGVFCTKMAKNECPNGEKILFLAGFWARGILLCKKMN